MPFIGVLALQGDFQKHIEAVRACGREANEIRTPADLSDCERLIIPGGESTTVGILLQKSGLDRAILERANEKMPIWGTCMGLILLAKEIEGREQWGLKLFDVAVIRNAYGPQINSFETDIEFRGFQEPFHAVFIRAPIISKVGEDVEVLASHNGHPVAIRQGNLFGTTFHPELTDDLRIHQFFLSQ